MRGRDESTEDLAAHGVDPDEGEGRARCDSCGDAMIETDAQGVVCPECDELPADVDPRRPNDSTRDTGGSSTLADFGGSGQSSITGFNGGGDE